MTLLANFAINTDDNSQPFIELTDESGSVFKAEMTPDMVYQIAQGVPRYANAMARSQKLGPNNTDPNVQLHADLVDASGALVDVDLLGEVVVLAIDDPHGIRVGWRLKPGLASSLGKQLQDCAENLSTTKPTSN